MRNQGEETLIFKNRRSEIEILDSMLSEANCEVKKTRMLYKANVCHSQFSDYFDFLLSQGFISLARDEPSLKTYVITEKGRYFHSSIRSILSLTKGSFM